MSEVRAVRDDDRAAWDEIASTSDDAWLSHSWRWNEQVEERVRAGARRSLVILRDGHLVGIVPQHLHTEGKGPVSRRVLHANYWIGGGVALANTITGADRLECFAAAMRATHAQARRDGVAKILLTLPALSRRNLRCDDEAKRAIGPGFADRSGRALVLRLRDRTEQDIWHGMEGRSRTKVNRAERAGVRVTQTSGMGAFESFYALHLATYRRTHASAHTPAYFEAVLSDPAFHVFFAEVDGRPIAAAIAALYAGRALYFASASLDEALHLGANNLLQWHVFRWLIGERVEAYELGLLPNTSDRGNQKERSIAGFLRSFGGDDVALYRGDYVYDRARDVMFSVAREILTRARRRGSN
jgi:hypothetical protein